ncbi:Gfo/Idh/MocA family protein [Singulisphaera sp. PoT]|uniref:Gfo/Idh/MocA family protein n=1 Tax=Singulisphaera sp. PoT TaxID=3411797 RepID=UPI003BF49722
MSHLSRRRFLSRSMAAAGISAGFAIGGTKSSGRVIGANDTIRIGVAGIHGRGREHIHEFARMKGVEITYLIDPDTRTYAPATALYALETLGKGAKPKTVQDVRQALDDKELDAISVATPNHWHSLLTIWGCQAGKDVYVEKPCSHNVHEGRVAVEAARKFDRIVQHGTQNRSNPYWINVAELVKSGKYGKLLVSRGLCYKRRKSIGTQPTTATPEGLDFNLWTGPAAEHAFNTNLVHYNWHWFWDFGNGDIGNQGVHEIDKARWLIPGATLPKSVISLGGRFGYQDQGETANTQIAVFDYGDTQLIFEVRGLETKGYFDQSVGNIAHLEEGTIAGNFFYPKKGGDREPLPKPENADKGQTNHFANFIDAVRSRKSSELHADILEGHYSSALCHLANISYRLGENVPFNSASKSFGDNKEAYETLGRMEEHLSKDNGLKLDELTYRVGPKLQVNAKTESFVNAPEADKLLTREYREPFTVPKSIA